MMIYGAINLRMEHGERTWLMMPPVGHPGVYWSQFGVTGFGTRTCALGGQGDGGPRVGGGEPWTNATAVEGGWTHVAAATVIDFVAHAKECNMRNSLECRCIVNHAKRNIFAYTSRTLCVHVCFKNT